MATATGLMVIRNGVRKCLYSRAQPVWLAQRSRWPPPQPTTPTPRLRSSCCLHQPTRLATQCETSQHLPRWSSAPHGATRQLSPSCTTCFSARCTATSITGLATGPMRRTLQSRSSYRRGRPSTGSAGRASRLWRGYTRWLTTWWSTGGGAVTRHSRLTTMNTRSTSAAPPPSVRLLSHWMLTCWRPRSGGSRRSNSR